jgi:hypothetical protein
MRCKGCRVLCMVCNHFNYALTFFVYDMNITRPTVLSQRFSIVRFGSIRKRGASVSTYGGRDKQLDTKSYRTDVANLMETWRTERRRTGGPPALEFNAVQDSDEG